MNKPLTMIKFSRCFLIGFVCLFAACNGGYNGQLLGVLDRPEWNTIVPYGMIYIPSGTLHIGQSDQDINNALIQKPKSISIQGFFMDETENSNNEYRQFVEFVKDSIAHKILGGELSPNVAKKAKENIKFAKVDDIVSIKNVDMKDFEVPAGRGVVVINPPYGERMDKDNIDELYKMMGDTFKKNFSGYDCWILSSNMEAFKHVGLRPSRKIQLYNGPLECRFMKFEMYAGTKKVHKLEGKTESGESKLVD